MIAKNWYPYSFKNIAEEKVILIYLYYYYIIFAVIVLNFQKGGHGLLEHFNNSISRALSDCYQFTMDPTEFNNVPRMFFFPSVFGVYFVDI